MSAGREFFVDVYPKIPKRLARLEELATNLWYAWHRPARALFGPLDPALWNRVGHNPKLFLKRIDEQHLRDAAQDEVFLSNYHKLLSAYDTYHGERSPQQNAALLAGDDLVAYFCAEYGLHESLPIYSGGLGILAGHHCKSASDFRLPFIAMGLLYQAGYFSQQIDDEGAQVAHYVTSDFDNLPIVAALDSEGKPLIVEVDFPGRAVFAKLWQVRAGHVSIYLLDTNLQDNDPTDRKITHQLYGGDRETRIKQELVLGLGGVRAIRRLGLRPTVWHMNEGHAAFAIVERIHELVAGGEDFSTALEYVASNCVFTTHTPVPAGHDYFSEEMVGHYLEPLRPKLGIDQAELLNLGRIEGAGDFNMTTLALKGSRFHNGVSRLHGTVSAALCSDCWPQVPAEENPMDYITNGVHVPTVLAQDWCDLFDRFLGAEWRNHMCDDDYWKGIHEVPDHVFWSVRQTVKSNMLRAVKESLATQHLRNQVSEPHSERMLKYIDPSDPNVLTVGFARRFATYKRATLLFDNLDWLRELTGDPERPVVIIFCGKAHPADLPGQQHIKEVHDISNRPEFVGKVLLVEGYDLGLARRFVAGVDVWLNNPVYAMEASGTSGMKAAINGTINLSVTDGWWAEGFEGDNGWAIRPSPHSEDEGRRDAEDARTLYEILQDDVIPLYYARGKYGYSQQWVNMAKVSMSSVLPRFNMSRVVNEYIEKLYFPAAKKGRELEADNYASARTLAAWKARVRSAWPGVSLRRLDDPVEQLHFGERLSLAVAADLNGLDPDDVMVEALVTRHAELDEAVARGNAPEESLPSSVRSNGEEHRSTLRFGFGQRLADTGEYKYSLDLEPEWCGRLNYRIRMYAHNALLAHPLETGLMIWL